MGASSNSARATISAGMFAAIAALGLALAGSGQAETAETTAKSKPGKIAFVSSDGNDDEIYVMNADGTGVTPLTDNDVADRGPSLSGNGKRIAFTSARDGGGDDDI